MIKYPPRPQQDQCSHLTPGDSTPVRETRILTNAISLANDALSSQAKQIENLERDRHEVWERLQEVSHQKQFAERAEEICGEIARGEFKPHPVDMRLTAAGNSDLPHDYTDSQKAVRELRLGYDLFKAEFETGMELVKQMEAEVVRLRAELNVAREACEISQSNISRLRVENSALKLNKRKKGAA